MTSGMRFISHPTVSGVLLPVDGSAKGESLEFSLGSDYRIGKLIRGGLDAVHGLDTNGRREYDPVKVRCKLSTIDTHIGQRKQVGSSPKVVVHQGHGNIGLNNYAVACKIGEDGSARLILPAGEPLHERVYPCFVKTRVGDRAPGYTIEDVIFFVERPDPLPQDWKIVDWVANRGGPEEAEFAKAPHPDRELLGGHVYIPIWDPLLKGQPLSRMDYDERIDWDGLKVSFAKIPRGNLGTVENLKLCLVPLDLNRTFIGTPIVGVEFAFFGIPVESLSHKDAHVGDELARHAHYYYDLRHLIDLIGVGSPEFYLLEYALKRGGFGQTRELLRNYRAGGPVLGPLQVDIEDLFDRAAQNKAHRAVLSTLAFYLRCPTALSGDLQAKGYTQLPSHAAKPDPGHFFIDGRILNVWPLRNTYSYSFIGIINVPGNERYLLLAATGGHGGLRPHGGYFGGALATGLNLEAALDSIYRNLAELWGLQFHEADRHDDDRLLLLDQGGDVHQWIGVGGLGYVVGSSEGRALMSALLMVLAP